MKIAIHITSLNIGGAERMTVELATGLAQWGHDVTIIVCDASGPVRGLIPTAMKLIDLGGISTLQSLPKMIKFLKDEKPDILLTALSQPNSVAVLSRRIARSTAKVILTIHSTFSKEAARPGFLQKLMPIFASRLFPKADRIVCVSNSVRDDLLKNLPVKSENVRTIENLAVGSNLATRAAEPSQSPWLSDDGPPVIISVGRLTDAKDFPNLLRAFDLVRRRIPARLLILGEGSERAALEQLIMELDLGDLVSLPGSVTNPYPELRAADLFVLSSKYEGMPSVLLEALACGTPVVATDCTSGPREILTDSLAQWLVPVGDPNALAEAIIRRLSEPRSAPNSAYWERFTPQVIVPKYIALFEEALAE